MKADKQVEALRAQVSAVEARERQAALAQAESIAKLEARCGAAVSAEQGLRQSVQSLEQELRAMREQLLAAQQDTMRYRTQAETVQSLLDRLGAAPAPSAASTKPASKKTA